MAEHTDPAEHALPEVARRRGPDLVTLVAGVLTLLVAVSTLVAQAYRLPVLDPRWLLAGGAAVLGLLLLTGSLRRRR